MRSFDDKHRSSNRHLIPVALIALLAGCGSPPSQLAGKSASVLQPVCRLQSPFWNQSDVYAVLSPNGSRVVAMFSEHWSYKRKLVVWDAKTGDLVSQMTLPVDRYPAFPELHCSADARIVCLHSRNIEVWDTQAKKQLMNMNHVLPSQSGVCLSPDGTTIAINLEASPLGIELLNVETGKRSGTLELPKGEQEYNDQMRPLCYSPDGMQLIVKRRDEGVLEVWNLSQKKRVARLAGHVTSPEAAVFSSDGTRMATIDASTIRGWDTASWQETCCIQRTKNSSLALAFSRDANSLWNYQAEDLVVAWNIQTGESSGAVRLSTPKNQESATVVMGQGRKAVHILESSLAIYDLDEAVASPGDASDLPLEVGQNDPQLIASVGFYAVQPSVSPDDKQAVAFGQAMLVLNPHDGTERQVLDPPYPVAHHAWSCDADFLGAILYQWDGKYDLFQCNVARGEWKSLASDLSSADETGPVGVPTCLDYSPDGSSLAIGYQTGQVRLIDRNSGEVLAVLRGTKEPLTALAFMPDSKRLVGVGREIFYWSLTDPDHPDSHAIPEPSMTGRSVVISTAGGIGVTSSERNDVVIWRLGTGEVSDVWNTPLTYARGVAVSPDGSFVAAWPGSGNGVDRATVYVYDVRQRKLHTTFSSPRTFEDVVFSHDNESVITTDNSAICIWKNTN